MLFLTPCELIKFLSFEEREFFTKCAKPSHKEYKLTKQKTTESTVLLMQIKRKSLVSVREDI